MRGAFRTSGFRGILVLPLLMPAGVSLGKADTTARLGAGAGFPAAQGKVRLRATWNGDTRIRVMVRSLAPPGRVFAGTQVFVVWVRGLAVGSAAHNLGALNVDSHWNGQLTAVTDLPDFDLFVTCERARTAAVPASPELFPFRSRGV